MKSRLKFKNVKRVDREIYDTLISEYKRQKNCIELIASENVPSIAVLEAQSSYHTLKYAEGYPKARYYAGCENIDKTEQLAIDRACKLFHCRFANVQPHSGTSANMAVLYALCKPGDKIMGMSLNSGGHLSHGAAPTFSGKYFKVVQYDVSIEKDNLIDYDALYRQVKKVKPRVLIVGASAYPRQIDFKRVREIVDEVNAEIYNALYKNISYNNNGSNNKSGDDNWDINEVFERDKKIYLMADIAHIAGLVAVGLHPSPFPHADVVTTTTHKTLRGPRGGLILWDDPELTKRINSAVFPGIQGGPLENIIAAKAVCFGEALSDEFVRYQEQVIKNAQRLAATLFDNGVKMVSSGTDNHLILIDLRGVKSGISGRDLEERLASINIITNKNAIPFDDTPKAVTSGLRVGVPAVTSRGFKEDEMDILGDLIAKCVFYDEETFKQKKEGLKKVVKKLVKKFPLK